MWYNILYSLNVGNIKSLYDKKDKKQFVGTREYVDMATGELQKTEAIFKKKEHKLNFIMMILDEVNITEVLSGLGSSGKVLGFIVKEYNDKDSMFYFTTSNKERMVTELGLSIGTVRSAVKEFTISDILCRVRGAEYMLNPSIFYKGSTDKRIEVVERYEGFKKANILKK